MSLGNLVLAALDLPGGERSSCEKILQQQAGNAWLTVPVKRKDCSFWLFNDAVNFPFGLASRRRPPQVIKNLGKMGENGVFLRLVGGFFGEPTQWKIATWCQSSWCAQVLFLTRALCVRSRFEHSNPRVSFCDSASRHVQFGARVLWVLALFFFSNCLKRGQWHVFRGGSLMRRQMPLQLPLKRHSPGTSQVVGYVGAGVGPAAGDWPRLRKWQKADRKEKCWDARHFIYNPSMHCPIFCIWDRLLAAWPWAEKLWAHAEQAG